MHCLLTLSVNFMVLLILKENMLPYGIYSVLNNK